MALWDQLKSRIADLQGNTKTQVAKYKSKDFAKASMAMCALIAAADGNVDAEERRKVAGLITTNEVLANFDAEDLRRRFDDYCNKLMADFDFGKVSLIQEIAKTKKKPNEARAVIQIGIIIGGADGNFDDDEKKVVREACFAVGISPSEFDL
jgi:tellurite resistance protein TerB